MKLISSKLYSNLFFNHVVKYIDRYRGGLGACICVAVSGGADSMALLFLAKELLTQKKISRLRALYFHHGTRLTQDEELAVVEHFCCRSGIDLEVVYLLGLRSTEAGFEIKARERRKSIEEYYAQDNIIWKGHHLNDSFEWMMMNMHKSSRMHVLLGMAYKAQSRVSPFLVVTKEHILKYCQANKIKYLNDPTNLDTKFERNYYRHEIIPKIVFKNPLYLKHYAHRSNELAQELGVYAGGSTKDYRIHYFPQITCLVHQGEGIVPVGILKRIISKMIHFKRVTYIDQINKIFELILQQNPKKGPLDIAGQLNVYFFKNQVFFVSKNLANQEEWITFYRKKL